MKNEGPCYPVLVKQEINRNNESIRFLIDGEIHWQPPL